MAKRLSAFCDLSCRYAEMPKDSGIDGAGSCRTFAALYCRQKKSLVHKNLPCAKKRQKGEAKKK